MLQKERAFTQPTEAGILSFKNLKSGVLKFTKLDKPGRGATKQTILTTSIMEAYEMQLKALFMTLFSSEKPFIENEI